MATELLMYVYVCACICLRAYSTLTAYNNKSIKFVRNKAKNVFRPGQQLKDDSSSPSKVKSENEKKVENKWWKNANEVAERRTQRTQIV